MLAASLYTVTCEQEKTAKLKMLSATREQLGNAEQAMLECNLSVQKIENEIALLRDRIVKKKISELRACKGKFDDKIEAYKLMYKAANNGREATQSHIDALKQRLGIGGGL